MIKEDLLPMLLGHQSAENIGAWKTSRNWALEELLSISWDEENYKDLCDSQRKS